MKLLKFKLSMQTVIDSPLNYPFTDNSSSSTITTKNKRIGLENAKRKESKHTFQSSVISLFILLDTHSKLSLGTNLKVNMVLPKFHFARGNYALIMLLKKAISPCLFISLFLPLLYLFFYFLFFPLLPSASLLFLQEFLNTYN